MDWCGNMNWYIFALQWCGASLIFLGGWMIGHDKGYAKARREFNK